MLAAHRSRFLVLLAFVALTTRCGRSEDAASATDEDDHENHDCSQHEASGTANEAAGVLARSDRLAVSTIRVSAHVGSVTLRRSDGVWKTAGASGCVVPPARVKEALDGLVALQPVPTTEQLPVGTPFELQIDALAGDRHVVHLEVAGRNDQGDLARLRDDSTARLRGLDRAFWLPDPVVWCRYP